MTRNIFQSLLSGTILGLGLALGLSLTSSHAQSCPSPEDPKAVESCSPNYFLATSGLSATGGRAGEDGAQTVNYPQLPNAGTLTFEDMTTMEATANTLLNQNRLFREAISPHQDKQNFDTLVRRFDYNSGFNRAYPGELQTIQQKPDKADRELRQARDFYAFLAVYANEARFRSQTTICSPPDDSKDRCNFAARMRESLREAAYLRMIFGQQFTADAMGLHFDGGEIIGGEVFVKDEVKKLELAAAQYQLAEQAVVEGMHIALGSGCFIADFYTDQEWALVSRAVEGLERARHHIAVRRSYLEGEGNGVLAAKHIYQSAAMTQYVQVIGTAGLQARAAQYGHCTKGARPDSNLVTEMVANLLETRQHAHNLQEGRNIFGFDVRFTPARPYLTLPNSTDTGLWDEAMAQARQAKEWQSDEGQASREFDRKQTELENALRDVKVTYDNRLRELSGCSHNDVNSDEEFFACIDSVIPKLVPCNPIMENQAAFDACIAGVPAAALLRRSWEDLRVAALRIKRNETGRDNMMQRVILEEGRNWDVNVRLQNNAEEQAWNQFALAMMESVNVSISSGGGPLGLPSASISFNPYARHIGAIRADSTLRQAESEADINSINSEATVRNIWLEYAELEVDVQVAVQELNALSSSFQMLAAEMKDVAIEAQRTRAYITASPANDPSYRLVRDSARLRLASQLSLAARISYMAAKRAEYEYSAHLTGQPCGTDRFRMTAIYLSRTADDIIRFLNCLRTITNSLPAGVTDAETTKEDFKISVAQHVLGYTDQYLRLTGAAADAERIRLFRAWVAQNTFVGADGKPVLQYNFSTSLAGNGIFSRVMQQSFETVWLQKMSGINMPKEGNTGFSINILTSQESARPLSYRTAFVKQGGVLHMRAFNGCVLDYSMIHPAALLGLTWPSTISPESVQVRLNASVNGAGQPTPGFLGRPVSATDWQVEIRAGSPDGVLAEMDLQQLRDIELIFSTTRATTVAQVNPQPFECVRPDS